jgi:hypothetical protein
MLFWFMMWENVWIKMASFEGKRLKSKISVVSACKRKEEQHTNGSAKNGQEGGASPAKKSRRVF